LTLLPRHQGGTQTWLEQSGFCRPETTVIEFMVSVSGRVRPVENGHRPDKTGVKIDVQLQQLSFRASVKARQRTDMCPLADRHGASSSI
jgi:hypothetical protein